MSKICPQRVLREAMRLLDELGDPNFIEKLDEVSEDDVDACVDDLQAVIDALDKAGIINLDT